MSSQSSGKTRVAVVGLGTALPPYRVSQVDLATWISRFLDRGIRLDHFTSRVFGKAGVDTRYMAIPDFTGTGRAVLYDDGIPGLGKRMEVFAREAPRLAAHAVETALEQASSTPSEVSHLIAVTSTGVSVPGVDVHIANALGLRPSVERTLIGMMGCSGAFHGLRVGRKIVEDDPTARVLMVCVELCSLHLDPDPDLGKIVAHALFSDAAAAVLLTGSAERQGALVELGTARTHLDYEARELVQWKLADAGFEITLSPRLAKTVGRRVRGFTDLLIEESRSSEGQRPIESWIVHPGGPALIRELEENLGLEAADLADAREVLRSTGNSSSAAVLFVLERAAARAQSGARGIMLGFGPGLTLEGLSFTHGPRRLPSRVP